MGSLPKMEIFEVAVSRGSRFGFLCGPGGCLLIGTLIKTQIAIPKCEVKTETIPSRHTKLSTPVAT